jgi:hypothetical protein
MQKVTCLNCISASSLAALSDVVEAVKALSVSSVFSGSAYGSKMKIEAKTQMAEKAM